jgi:hypothetical protein
MIKTKDLVIIPRATYSESECIALIETNLNYWYYFVERGDIFITTDMSEKALEVFSLIILVCIIAVKSILFVIN